MGQQFVNNVNQLKPGQDSYYKYDPGCISFLMCHFARRVLTSDWACRVQLKTHDGSRTSQEDRPQSDVVGVSWQKEVQKWKVEIDTRLAYQGDT